MVKKQQHKSLFDSKIISIITTQMLLNSHATFQFSVIVITSNRIILHTKLKR